ncbi:MAG: homocysteine S-methyltransferase family protein [Acidobacteria bacterium]|nr:homocysteine S-methyltransferase family protein [Acidobacteriota bacterium]
MENITALPHRSERLFLTDGGLETTLIFLEGFDLPCFASFDLLKNDAGYEALKKYYSGYLKMARDHNMGFILESPTWRAGKDWMEPTGYPLSAVSDINRKAIGMMRELRDEFANGSEQILISGCVGPRGDGYRPETMMTAEEAKGYHSEQIAIFASEGVDMISAITMTHTGEAIGIAQAAADAGIPSVISFTVETDGKLPSGMSLGDAISETDASTSTPPAYYMINCAHPTHFADELAAAQDTIWAERIRGIRANASRKSHAELDESTDLDRGDMKDFGDGHARLKELLPHLNVFGGCCGTDEEHVLTLAAQMTAPHFA